MAAMDHYLEELPDATVYFLAVSDDMAWVGRALGGRRGLVLAGALGDMGGPQGPESLVGGEEGLDPVGRDLALLAACNHTIVSQVLGWGRLVC